MRTLFVLLFLANVMLFGVGQGWFGLPPSEEGRDRGRHNEMNADRAVVGRHH